MERAQTIGLAAASRLRGEQRHRQPRDHLQDQTDINTTQGVEPPGSDGACVPVRALMRPIGASYGLADLKPHLDAGGSGRMC